MGTWGAGPLDSDTALDFRQAVTDAPTAQDRYLLLRGRVEELVRYGERLARGEEGDPEDLELEAMVVSGVAACALIAEAAAGDYLYGWPPDPQQPDPDGFTLELMPPLTADLVEEAVAAARVVRRFCAPTEDEDAAEGEYAAMLDLLVGRLEAALAAAVG